jgi:hypothetical protein
MLISRSMAYAAKWSGIIAEWMGFRELTDLSIQRQLCNNMFKLSVVVFSQLHERVRRIRHIRVDRRIGPKRGTG